jgi:carbon-monoxide dehydrogenase medium subunit
MKPSPFEYKRAESFEQACQFLSEAPMDAKLLAGGQTLIPMLNFRLARPKILIDISRIADPNRITEEAEGVRIRATTVQRAVERSLAVQNAFPLLHCAVQHVAHVQIRNKGTIGGSIANADPASELPAMTLVFDAELEVRNAREERKIAAEDFFVSYYMTSMEPDEVLTSIYFPAPPKGTGWGFHELARRSGDFAIAGGAALVTVDESGICRRARVVVFGVAPTPVRATAAEELLVGQSYSDELVREASGMIRSVVDPESDVHASAEYRRITAEVMARRAIGDAFKKATSKH